MGRVFGLTSSRFDTTKGTTATLSASRRLLLYRARVDQEGKKIEAKEIIKITNAFRARLRHLTHNGVSRAHVQRERKTDRVTCRAPDACFNYAARVTYPDDS